MQEQNEPQLTQAQIEEQCRHFLLEVYKDIQLGNFQALQEKFNEVDAYEKKNQLMQYLLSLPIPAAQDSNLIQALLYKLDAVRGQRAMFDGLYDFLTRIITTYPQELNLQFVDGENNTALHKTCWYAIKYELFGLLSNADEERTSLQFEKITQLLLQSISPANFRRIMSIKNDYNQAFLEHILYLPNNNRRYVVKDSFHERFKSTICPMLDRFRNKSAQVLGEKIDFAEKDFQTRLGELLDDPVTWDLMTNPYWIKTQGHTFSLNSLPPSNKNPLNQIPFNRATDLVPNVRVAEVIRLYTKFQEEHNLTNLVQGMDRCLLPESAQAKLAEFAEVPDAEGVVPDYKVRELKHLLESYHAHLDLQKVVAPDAAVAPKPRTVNPNEAIILAGLQNYSQKELGWFDMGDGFEVGRGRMLKVPSYASPQYQINLIDGKLSILDKTKKFTEIKDSIIKNQVINLFAKKIDPAHFQEPVVIAPVVAAAAASPGFFAPEVVQPNKEPAGPLLSKLLTLVNEINEALARREQNLNILEEYMMNELANGSISRDKELKLVGMIAALAESAPADHPIKFLFEAYIEPKEFNASKEFKLEAREIFTKDQPDHGAAAGAGPKLLTVEIIEQFMADKNAPKP